LVGGGHSRYSHAPRGARKRRRLKSWAGSIPAASTSAFRAHRLSSASSVVGSGDACACRLAAARSSAEAGSSGSTSSVYCCVVSGARVAHESLGSTTSVARRTASCLRGSPRRRPRRRRAALPCTRPPVANGLEFPGGQLYVLEDATRHRLRGCLSRRACRRVP
jgi:hypothetical protein